jgi:hypothetical protein
MISERHRVQNMAYENRNAAYDLSLFDQASAAPLPKRDEEVEKVKEPKKKTGKSNFSAGRGIT